MWLFSFCTFVCFISLKCKNFGWALINYLFLTYCTGGCDNLLSLQAAQVQGEALDVVSCASSKAGQILDCLTTLHSIVSCFIFYSFLILYCKRLRCSALKGMVTMHRTAVHCCKLIAMVGILWPFGAPHDRTKATITSFIYPTECTTRLL